MDKNINFNLFSVSVSASVSAETRMEAEIRFRFGFGHKNLFRSVTNLQFSNKDMYKKRGTKNFANTCMQIGRFIL